MSKKEEKIREFRCEFHIHTVLSPCASVEMIPPLIIQTAEEKGINLVAVTDHNAIANIRPVMEAARGSEIAVLPGLELQTREEIHSVCLFDSFEKITNFFSFILLNFPDIENNAEYFGEQFVVDKNGVFIKRESRLLITSCSLSLTEAWNIVNDYGGMLIPAHVNRFAFGLIPVLGFIPSDIQPEALEISRHLTVDKAIINFPQLRDFPLIRSGDAHMLDEICGFNIFRIAAPTIKEIRMALQNIEGRSFLVSSE